MFHAFLIDRYYVFLKGLPEDSKTVSNHTHMMRCNQCCFFHSTVSWCLVFWNKNSVDFCFATRHILSSNFTFSLTICTRPYFFVFLSISNHCVLSENKAFSNMKDWRMTAVSKNNNENICSSPQQSIYGEKPVSGGLVLNVLHVYVLHLN